MAAQFTQDLTWQTKAPTKQGSKVAATSLPLGAGDELTMLRVLMPYGGRNCFCCRGRLATTMLYKKYNNIKSTFSIVQGSE